MFSGRRGRRPSHVGGCETSISLSSHGTSISLSSTSNYPRREAQDARFLYNRLRQLTERQHFIYHFARQASDECAPRRCVSLGWHDTQAAHAGAFMRHRHSQARHIGKRGTSLFWQLTQPVVQTPPLRGSDSAFFCRSRVVL